MPLELPSKFLGSGLTKVRVYAYRHNRQNSNGSGHLHGEYNITNLVTQISLDQHLTGGGRCTLVCVPHLPIEDNLAANDIMNVYINTGRTQEEYEYSDSNSTNKYSREENTWKYNKGWVRTFFGYIDTINRSTVVDSEGAKQTSYSIVCSSFDKAIRSTEVYVNPHLTFSGEGEDGKPQDIVRQDISTNLGGLLLLQKGFMIAGPPRQLIISHLMRSLGFGGQWLLPLGYRDSLYPTEIHAKFGVQKSTEIEAAKTKRDFKFTVSLKRVKKTNASINTDGEHLLSNTTFSIPFASGDTPKFLDNGVRGDLNEALVQVATEAKIKHWTTRRLLLAEFKLDENLLADAEEQQDGTVIFAGELDLKVVAMIEKMGIISKVNQKGEKVDQFKPSLEFKKLAFRKSIPKLTPNVNQTTIPGHGNATPAQTLFNILCLDYMEEVDGQYVLSQMFNFGGPLSSQLTSQAHDLINEFYFDLRPAPDFKQSSRDGLGHDIDGAIPMVPSVVLREKPFTIYKSPKAKVQDLDQKNIISTGGVEVGSQFTDQLFLNMLNQRGFRKFSGKDFEQVRDFVQSLGANLRVQKVATKEKPKTKGKGKVADKKRPDGSDKTKKAITVDGSGAPNVIDPEKVSLVSEEPLDVAERPYSLVFSLPRPVFASPDGGRVTIEAKVSSQETILGIVKNEKVKGKDQFRVKFMVVGTDKVEHGVSADKFNSKNLNYYRPQDGKSKYLALGPNSSQSDLAKEVRNAPKTSWHVLEYMTVRSADVLNESYYRGDQEIINILELFGDINPDFEFQKAIVSDKLPVITPISVQRSGVRVSSNITSFIQHLLTGGPSSHAWNAALGYRWVTMLDLWNQHNHELLTGSLTIKGMPGLRPGYRLDRPELKLSFYVESVGHEWTYPGYMATQVTVTRGQPANWGEQERILDYIPPEPRVHSNIQKRVALGKVFPVQTSTTDGEGSELIRPVPGSVIGLPEKFTQKDLNDG